MELIGTIRTDAGEAVGSVIVAPKAFDSGSDGFFGQRKLEWEGARYQVQMQLVRIGSKEENNAEANTEAAPEA